VVEFLVGLFKSSSLLLLVFVVTVGFLLGQIKILGVRLGVAMVLFVGIAVGTLDRELKLPDLIFHFGLALFVYTVGLSSAPSFFRALNRNGLKQSGLAVASIFVSLIVVVVLSPLFGLSKGVAGTLFAGSLTNAPALVSVLDVLRGQGVNEAEIGRVVAGYAISYPPGILLPLLLIVLARKLYRVDLKEEAKSIPSFRLMNEQIHPYTVKITNEEACGVKVEEISAKLGSGFTFGRLKRGDSSEVVRSGLVFHLDDRVTVIGPDSVVQRVAGYLGELTEDHLELDRHELDYRRVFVSNDKIAGRTLAEINLPEKYQAVVTRVKRGDLEFIPTGGTTLQLGDRVRILAKREDHPEIAKLFGDKNPSLTDGDMVSLFLGLLLGLFIGEIPIPLPGGTIFKLGFAGGPLIVALILGRLQRTGPIVWNIPQTANLTLRQLGLAIFAAGVGLRSGYQFLETLESGRAMPIFLVGCASSLAMGFVVLIYGYKVMKIPLNTLYGIYAAAQTQPVTLAFASSQTQNELPNAAYATSSPFGTIAKIVFATLILTILK
jgi:putative transport protein